MLAFLALNQKKISYRLSGGAPSLHCIGMASVRFILV